MFHLSDDRQKAYFALIIASLAVSVAPTLVRFSFIYGNSATLTAFMRLFFASLVMLAIGFYQHSLSLEKQTIKDVFLLIIAGFFLAIHFATWMASISLTTLAISTVLVNTAPLFVIVLTYFMGDHLSRHQLLGITIGMIAATLIGLEKSGTESDLWGSILALIGASTVAVYVAIGRKYRPSVSLATYTTVVYSSCSAFLGLFLVLGIFNSSINELWTLSVEDVIIFTLLAVGPSCLGHSLYNYALKYLKGPIVSLTFLAESVGSIILALLLFHEFPSVYFYVAASILILSVIGVIYIDQPETAS